MVVSCDGIMIDIFLHYSVSITLCNFHSEYLLVSQLEKHETLLLRVIHIKSLIISFSRMLARSRYVLVQLLVILLLTEESGAAPVNFEVKSVSMKALKCRTQL